MKLIGLCGSSGSGKSTVSAIFRELGAVILDCDQIYHDLINRPSMCLFAIGEQFGSNVIQSGKLNRKVLREIVFSDETARDDLNRITHAYVIAEIEILLKQYQDQYSLCFIDAPLLIESGLDQRCDATIAVISTLENRLERIMSRDNLSLHEAQQRIQSQLSNDELIKRCNIIIQNDNDMDALYESCKRIFNQFTS